MLEKLTWQGTMGSLWDLRVVSSWRPEKSWGPQSCKCEEINFAKNLNEPGNIFFPSQASRLQCCPDNTMIKVFWDPEQNTQVNQT